MSSPCPPPPKVQSTATSPGCGSRSSITSPAKTGTWVAVMSSRMAKAGGDVGELVGEGGVVVGPGAAVPDLEAVAGAGDDDVLPERPVLEQEARHHHAAGGVELGVERVRGEVAVELACGLRERVEPGERATHVLVERLRRPDLHAALDALRQHDALTERGPELGRDREPVLGVEGVVEGAAEGHLSSRVTPAGWRGRVPAFRAARPRPARLDADRGGGVGGAPPPRSAATLLPHYLPLGNTTCTFFPTNVPSLTPRRALSPS